MRSKILLIRELIKKKKKLVKGHKFVLGGFRDLRLRELTTYTSATSHKNILQRSCIVKQVIYGLCNRVEL